MQSEFFWLAAADVIEINLDIVTGTAEPHAVLDHYKLESALGRPQAMALYSGVDNTLSLGISYMVSIAQAHPFLQGNKRTGFVAGRMFMQNHGYDLLLPDTEAIADFFMEVIIDPTKVQLFETHLENYVVEFDE